MAARRETSMLSLPMSKSNSSLLLFKIPMAIVVASVPRKQRGYTRSLRTEVVPRPQSRDSSFWIQLPAQIKGRLSYTICVPNSPLDNARFHPLSYSYSTSFIICLIRYSDLVSSTHLRCRSLMACQGGEGVAVSVCSSYGVDSRLSISISSSTSSGLTWCVFLRTTYKHVWWLASKEWIVTMVATPMVSLRKVSIGWNVSNAWEPVSLTAHVKQGWACISLTQPFLNFVYGWELPQNRK